MTNKLIRVALGVAATLLIASNASAGLFDDGLLTNGSFEDPGFAGAEQAGAGAGWTTFGQPFRIQGGPEPMGTPGGALDGTVALKAFDGGGAFQDVFDVNAGDTVNASVFMLNPDNADALRNGGFAAVNLEFFDAGGLSLSGILSNDTFLEDRTRGEWFEQTISAIAPDNTAFVRMALFMSAGDGGAVRWDAASLTVQAVPVPAAVLLFAPALLGLMGFRRKTAA